MTLGLSDHSVPVLAVSSNSLVLSSRVQPVKDVPFPTGFSRIDYSYIGVLTEQITSLLTGKLR